MKIHTVTKYTLHELPLHLVNFKGVLVLVYCPLQVVKIDRSNLDIGRRVGKGGFGSVYEGKMMVAIKVIHTNEPGVTSQEIKV